ncbi:MAG: acyl-CoA dehydrogenase family protein [Acidimicrobiales bacterium]
MDVDDTPAEAAFRAEVRAFLAEHAPDVTPLVGVWPPRVIDHERDARFIDASRAWQRCRAEHGFAGIGWPEAYGGRGLGPVFEAIFAEEEGMAMLLSGLFSVGIGMVGPTIIAHGTHEQKTAFLAPLLAASRCGASSSASPTPAATSPASRPAPSGDGDEWVIHGQKVWTSHAHAADWGILLARSNPDVPKHRGITCFLVDMRAPGIGATPAAGDRLGGVQRGVPRRVAPLGRRSARPGRRRLASGDDHADLRAGEHRWQHGGAVAR